jgi:hypothetical protein
MSINSVDDFEPSSSTAVFGSTVSQTKLQQQQQPTNDLGGAEKLITPPQPTVNGQNETTNNKNSDNLGNTSTASINGNNDTTDATNVHVNGKNEKTVADTLPSTNTTTEESVSTSGTADSVEKSSQNDSLPGSSNEPTGNVTSTAPPPVDPPAPTEPEPILSTSADVAKRDLTSAPATVADNAPPVPALSAEPTTSTSNEDVPASVTAPEATVLAESATPELKSKVINLFFFLIYSDFLIFFVKIVSSW